MRSPEHRFGEELRARRLSIGLSQEALAERAELHRNYVSLLERGLRSPSLGVLFQLAGALSASPSDLVRETEERLSRGGPGRRKAS